MPRDKKNAQAKIDPWKYDELEKAAQKEDMTVSEFLRTLINDAIGDQELNIKDDLIKDIATLSGEWPVSDNDFSSARSILNERWDDVFTDDVVSIWDKVTAVGHVYVIGQGTSYSVAKYLAHTLRRRNVNAQAYKAEEFLNKVNDENGILIAISRSGQTESIVGAAKDASGRGMPVVAQTESDSQLENIATHTIPLPKVSEATKAYTTRASFLQLVILQTIFSTDDIVSKDDFSRENTLNRVNKIEKFIDNHVTFSFDKNETGLSKFRLASSSPFRTMSSELKNSQDLRLNPIFASLGRYQPQTHEFAHKITEFLHIFSDYDTLGHVRDHYVNILFNESGYLVTPVPPKDSDEYERCYDYLFNDRASVKNLLTSTRPKPFRWITITTNKRNGRIEEACANFSRYEDASVIRLESSDNLTNDLIMFVASFLFTYSILSEAWGSDPEIRQNVPRTIDHRPR